MIEKKLHKLFMNVKFRKTSCKGQGHYNLIVINHITATLLVKYVLLLLCVIFSKVLLKRMLTNMNKSAAVKWYAGYTEDQSISVGFPSLCLHVILTARSLWTSLGVIKRLFWGLIRHIKEPYLPMMWVQCMRLNYGHCPITAPFQDKPQNISFFVR